MGAAESDQSGSDGKDQEVDPKAEVIDANNPKAEVVDANKADETIPLPAEESAPASALHKSSGRSRKQPSPREDLIGLVVLDPDLLRGVDAADVLSKESLEEDFANREAAWTISRPVSHIDDFVTYSSEIPAWRRRLVLQFGWNGDAALIGGYIAALLTYSLQSSVVGIQVLPSMATFTSATRRNIVPCSCWCSMFGVLAQILLWRYWQNIRGVFWPRRVAFIDKFCIAFHDEEKRCKGVRMLGGITRRSQRLFLITESSFFRQLWNMVDVASFVYTRILGVDSGKETSNQERSLQQLAMRKGLADRSIAFAAPVWLVSLLLGLTASMWVIVTFVYLYFLVISEVISKVQILFVLQAIGFLLFAPVWVRASRVYSRECAELKHTLRKFSVREARVSLYEDRVLIESSIRVWFGSIKSFDHFVRTTLCDALREQISVASIPYRYMLFLGFPFFCAHCDMNAQKPYYTFIESARHMQVLLVHTFLFPEVWVKLLFSCMDILQPWLGHEGLLSSLFLGLLGTILGLILLILPVVTRSNGVFVVTAVYALIAIGGRLYGHYCVRASADDEEGLYDSQHDKKYGSCD